MTSSAKSIIALGVVGVLAACTTTITETEGEARETDASGDGGPSRALTDGSASPDGVCAQYLACAAKATPELYPSMLQAYGSGGSCWSLAPATQCEQACSSALANAARAFSDEVACTPVARCAPYLACLGAVVADRRSEQDRIEAQVEQRGAQEMFARDGSCWGQATPDECAQQCDSALERAAARFPAQPLCNPNPVCGAEVLSAPALRGVSATCRTCLGASCCGEVQQCFNAAGGDDQCSQLLECKNACSTQDCAIDCTIRLGNGGPAYQEFVECSWKCESECAR